MRWSACEKGTPIVDMWTGEGGDSPSLVPGRAVQHLNREEWATAASSLSPHVENFSHPGILCFLKVFLTFKPLHLLFILLAVYIYSLSSVLFSTASISPHSSVFVWPTRTHHSSFSSYVPLFLESWIRCFLYILLSTQDFRQGSTRLNVCLPQWAISLVRTDMCLTYIPNTQ